MALTFTTKGYSAMGTIGGEKIFLTSYSLAYDNNIIRSNAIVNLMYSDSASSSSPYKLLPGYVQAEPRFEISISYELKSGDQGDVLSDFTSYLKTASETISIQDNQKGLNFKFDKCYWIGTTLAVENNSIVTCTKTYIYFDSSFEFVQTSSSSSSSTMSGGSCLIPYYKTKTNFGSTMSFSLSIRRNLTPKYGCFGSSSGSTPTLHKIIMGLVEISLQITCFLKGHVIKNTQFSSVEFIIGSKKITFNECCLQSINHNIGDNSTISYSYSVFGRVTTGDK